MNNPIKMNKFILGTAQFGFDYGINNVSGKVSDVELKKILDFSFDSGVRVLDTAEAYGNSHERIGSYHKNSSNKFEIITKFSQKNYYHEKISFEEKIYFHLRTLGVEKLYCYMFHSFKDYKKYFSLFKEEILTLKHNGVINKVGVSLYTNQELLEVIKDECIELVQLPFNLLDNHSRRGQVLLKAKEKGVEIHTRSVFLQGLFFKKNINDIPGLCKLTNYMDKLQCLCNDDIKINELALSYVLTKDYIDNVIIGVDNIDQIKSNVSLSNLTISEEIIREIDAIIVKENKLLNPTNW